MPGSSPVIAVYLLDDESMVRGGLRTLLELSGGLKVIGESGDARSGIEEIARLRPAVAVVDIAMPALSGLDAIGPIKRRSPATKVLIASQHERRTIIVQALSAGADGYVSKSADPGELAAAVEAVHHGESYVSPRVAAHLLEGLRDRPGAAGPSGLAGLTTREREIFQLLAVGHTNKDIARLLGIALGTARKHRENIQRKLACHSPAELARLAIREGLFAP